MDKFKEYFRTTKHYENMLLEIARNQLAVSVFDKNGRKYRNHIVQTAYEVFQHQQAKVEELQKRVDAQTKHVEMALLAVKDIYKSAIDEFHNWDVLNEKEPKLCDHLQNLSVATGELKQALKGEG